MQSRNQPSTGVRYGFAYLFQFSNGLSLSKIDIYLQEGLFPDEWAFGVSIAFLDSNYTSST
jgi:hypothetical protein